MVVLWMFIGHKYLAYKHE